MTKEELYKLLKQVKKENDVVITWISAEGKLVWHHVCDVKVNLTKERVEFHLDC